MKLYFDLMKSEAMLRIVAIAFLSVLTIQGDLYGQQELKAFQSENDHRIPQYPLPQPNLPQGAHVKAHEGDSLVLVALYNSTGGPTSWIDRSGWLQDPVSEWYGIKLDPLGRLNTISLGGNNLSGVIPPGLGQVISLEYLFMGFSRSTFNHLTGPIPPELGELVNLKWLDLGHNQLEGDIPLELTQLTELTVLDLSHNDLTGPVPPQLDQLIVLKSLLLDGNKLSGIIPSELGNLNNLEGLGLGRNTLSGSIPPEFGNLNNLDRLYLDSNNLSGQIPPELGRLSRLEDMWLDDNKLSGPIPPEFGQLSSLNRMMLFDNNLSGQIPPELGLLTDLYDLRLAGNRLSGLVPSELGQLKQLRYLELDDNILSGPIPPELGNYKEMWRLTLNDNGFSGPIPPELGQLEMLFHLDLSGNELSGPFPPELGKLGRLEKLYVNNNQLSGPIPNWTISNKLRYMYVQANKFLFADLLSYDDLRRLYEFTYAPQDTIDTQLNCSASEYVFTTPATAQGNHYQWYLNDQVMPGERAVSLRLTSVSEGDSYHATITNSALPDLTLTSRKASTRGASRCTAQQYASVADSTLLVDFYNRTQGSLLWHTQTGWLEEPVAQWYGITLDASGRVTEVSLPNNNLVGQLPLSQLHKLPNLRRLDVSGNEFSGTIPKGLGALTQLEYLDLSRNTLAGELPKELAGQAPLKMLNVTGNQLVGTIPTELSQITTLQTFSVSANQLSGPVPAFTGLDQLDTLHVAQNAFLFMDLLPNASLTRLDDFVYAPQDSVETLLTRTASGFALTTAAKAAGNRYQWYRDDQPISGPQSDTLQVSATSDPAQYHATITNDRLLALTLVSRKKGVHDGLTLTEGELPDNFLLHQSYPNPFAAATTVAFELGTPEHVRIVVYDLLGKVVATIADGRFTAGMHRVEFTGDHLASGQYMYRMEAGAYRATRFMSVVR